MSTLRYRVLAPSGIYIGTDFYPANSIVKLTAKGAKYFLLNWQIAIASEQAPNGPPSGPNEDDVSIDILINNQIRTVSLTQLRDMFPSIKGPPGPAGQPGPKGDKGEPGRGFSLKGEVGAYEDLPTNAPDGDAYVVSATGTGWVWSQGIWIGIGPFRGPQGLKGDIGPKGPKGDKGDNGDKGDEGAIGPQGPKGDKGSAGDQGPQGVQGIRGPKGDTGDQGPQGIQGPKGDKGDVGPQGPKGDQGLPGLGDMLSVNNLSDVANASTALHNLGGAPLNSPEFAGTPTAPTPATGDSSAKIATTAYVSDNLASYVSSTALTTTLAAYVTSSALTSTLGAYAPLASPAFAGTPTAPTPAPGDNSAKIATTAYVDAKIGTATPLAPSGSGTVGSSARWAHEDHVHPVDTTRAPLNSPAFTGTPTAPTPAASDNSTAIATTAYVTNAVAPLIGSVNYQGTWNASTNTPALASGTGRKGTLYKVSVAGTTAIDGISQWNQGDCIVFNGTTWDKIDGLATEVTSVAGRVGAVTLSYSDISGLGGAATRNVGAGSGTVAAGDDSRFTNGAFTTLTVSGNGVWHGGNFNPANYVPLNGSVQLTGSLTGASVSLAMSQDGGATRGSFVCRAPSSGDSNLAGMTFWNDSYALKLGIRADGYFGFGGWSRAPWSFYSDPSGNVTAGGNITAYSDPALKDDIVRIADALDIIGRLDGVRFTWNGKTKLIGRSGERDIGVLADQVEAVLPELVNLSIPDDGNDGKRWRTVAYDKLVPVLIEGIKAQQTEIEALLSWARSNGFNG